jgi:hypothetical protein
MSKKFALEITESEANTLQTALATLYLRYLGKLPRLHKMQDSERVFAAADTQQLFDKVKALCNTESKIDNHVKPEPTYVAPTFKPF